MKRYEQNTLDGLFRRWPGFWLGAGILLAGGEIIANGPLGRFSLLWAVCPRYPWVALPLNSLLYLFVILVAGLVFGFLAELLRRLCRAEPSFHPAVAGGLLAGFVVYLGYGAFASVSGPSGVIWWWGGGFLAAAAVAFGGYAVGLFREWERSVLILASILLGVIVFSIADYYFPPSVHRIGLGLLSAVAIAGCLLFRLVRIVPRRLVFTVGWLAAGVCIIQTIYFSLPGSGYDRHLLFFLWDAQRPDRTSVYDRAYETTPVLLSLSDQMIRFKRAYSPANYTFASTVSIFTGRYLREHHLYDGSVADIARYESFSDLAGDMAGKGYRPVMITESPWLVALGKNFREVGRYPTRRDTASIFFPYYRSPFVVIQILDHLSFLQDGLFKSSVVHLQDRYLSELLLRARRDGPYFLYVCWMNAHSRYYPGGAGLRSTSPDALRSVPESEYLRATEYMDSRLGGWIERMRKAGQWERTLAFLTADHGEFLGEFGMVGHGKALLEPVLHVPLLLFGPEVVPDVIEEPVPLVALRRGISALIGNGEEGWETEAFIGEMVNNRGMVVEGSFEELEPGNTIRWFLAAWDGKIKYMQDRHRYIPDHFEGLDTESFYFLYDLERDPGEAQNLADERPEDVARMQGLIDRWEAKLDPAPLPSAEEEEGEYPPGLAEEMRALGYDL